MAMNEKMVSVELTLDAEDQEWVEMVARREGVPVEEVLRRAIRSLRSESERAAAERVPGSRGS
jgi:hypothetical protein